METATTTITTKTTTYPVTRHIGNYAVIDHPDEGELLVFPKAQELWSFQTATSYRDHSYGMDSGELADGEAAYNYLRDELGYDADEIMDWVSHGEVAFLSPQNVLIVGAK